MTDRTEAQGELTPIEQKANSLQQDCSVDGDNRDFDWQDDESVIISEQPQTACYWNPSGQVVLRQHGCARCDEDSFLVFNLENVPALIFALKQMLEK